MSLDRLPFESERMGKEPLCNHMKRWAPRARRFESLRRMDAPHHHALCALHLYIFSGWDDHGGGALRLSSQEYPGVR